MDALRSSFSHRVRLFSKSTVEIERLVGLKSKELPLSYRLREEIKLLYIS